MWRSACARSVTTSSLTALLGFSKYALLACTTFVLLGCTSAEKPAPTYAGHGASSVSRKEIESFAPPALPPQISRYVQNILEITEPGLGLVSADGKAMYFTWNISGTRQVWKIDGPMRFPVQLTSGSDPTSVFDISPTDGKYLVLTRDRAGEEDPGLYLLPTAGGPLIEVQHKKGVRTRPVWITNDGDTLYYTANDIKPDSYALYSYEIRTGKKNLLFSEPGLWFVADVINDQRFLLGKMTGARTREYYQWSVLDPKLEPVLGQGEKEEYFVQFAPGNNRFFVSTPKFGDFQRLYLFENGKFTAITPEVNKDVESVLSDYRRFRLYLQWNDNGHSRLEVRDPRTLQQIPMVEFKGADHVYVGKSSRMGRYVPIGVETGLGPRVNYVFDWLTKTAVQWSRPSLPESDASRFSAVVTESYPARDGVKIPMLVTRPKTCAAEPCPVIVHFHGGPEVQSRPGFNRMAQIFAGAGFIFVEPNVRGSDGYGRKWRSMDDGAKRLDVITDIEDCAKYIRTSWAKAGTSPRIGVIGGSYGGYSVLMAMSRFAGAYDAGVAMVGMSNLRTFLKNTAAYRSILRISEYGDPEKDKDVLEKLSPINYVEQIRDPLMIIQGVSDPRVPVGEAMQMHKALVARGIDAPLILFADEGHGAGKRDNRVLEYGHALKFLQDKLLKVPVVASSSRPQS